MTEKRFELDWEGDEMCNVYDNQIESHISVEEVEELLNEQHETIQSLKLELELSKPLFSRRQIEAELKELREIGDYQADRIKELTEENTKLEDRIKEAYENERTHLGRSVLKQLLNKVE